MFTPGQFKSRCLGLTSPGLLKWCPVWWRTQAPRMRMTLFLLSSTSHLVWNLRSKGKRTKKIFESKSPPFLFDLLGVSRPLSPLRWLARWAFHPQKIERVLKCATCFGPLGDAPHQHATRCGISSHDKIAASKESCGIDSKLREFCLSTLVCVPYSFCWVISGGRCNRSCTDRKNRQSAEFTFAAAKHTDLRLQTCTEFTTKGVILQLGVSSRHWRAYNTTVKVS